MVSKWEERKQVVYEMLISGKTLDEIGAFYGVTKQRIEQITKKYFPDLHKSWRGAGARRRKNRKEQIQNWVSKYNRDTWFGNDLQLAMSAFFTRKKQNTKKKKWEFNLDMSDLDWPTHCPILGIELDWFAEKCQEDSPSLDRLDTKLGYIPGNVVIMSWRANRIKNNGTSEEHLKIAAFMQSYGL